MTLNLEQVLVMIFDLEGYSRLLDHPDNRGAAIKLMRHVFGCVNMSFLGGNAYWSPMTYDPSLSHPVHIKRQGDGGIYIWREMEHQDVLTLTDRLCDIGMGWKSIMDRCRDIVPGVVLPKRIRFCLTAGEVEWEELDRDRPEDQCASCPEFHGYPVVLASKLLKHCRQLSFIASQRIGLTRHELVKHEYVRVIANNLPGLRPEIVFVDEKEFDGLEPEIRNGLFSQKMVTEMG